MIKNKALYKSICQPLSISLPTPSTSQPVSFLETTNITSFLCILQEILHAHTSYIYTYTHTHTSFSSYLGNSDAGHTLAGRATCLNSPQGLYMLISCVGRLPVVPVHPQHFFWWPLEGEWSCSVSSQNIRSASSSAESWAGQ